MSNELYDHSSRKDDAEDGDQQNNSEDSPEKDSNEEKTEPVSLQQMEALEEAKLKSKYPQAMRPGGSAFLQKRLHKGQKYFDSGDYNMAKAKGGTKARTQQILQGPIGEAIPTPDNLPTRKVSLVQSKLAAGLS